MAELLYLNTIYQNHQHQEDDQILIEEDIGTDNSSELVVYNDDHNTFDWVIQCFIEILKHTEPQAEQCSLLIHFKGKAIVKTAPFNVLKPLKSALIDRGLSAVIERL